MTYVKLPKEYSRKKIIEACEEAAKELRYKFRTIQEYEEKYHLGSVREVKTPSYTTIIVRGTFLTKFDIQVFSSKTNDEFVISKHSATTKTMKKYLDAVSRHLK